MNLTSSVVYHGDLPRVEIRGKASITPGTCANILIKVSPTGDTIPVRDYNHPKAYKLKQGVNVQLSLNSTAELTWDDWENINEAVRKAKQMLNDLEWVKVNKGRQE